MASTATGHSSAKTIARPGHTVDKTLAELLEIDDESDVVVAWREQMREIEKAERSAESDEASVRIR